MATGSRQSRWARWLALVPIFFILFSGILVFGFRDAESAFYSLQRGLRILVGPVSWLTVFFTACTVPYTVAQCAFEDRASGRLDCLKLAGVSLWAVPLAWSWGAAVACALHVVNLIPFYVFVWVAAPDALTITPLLCGLYIALAAGPIAALSAVLFSRVTHAQIVSMALSAGAVAWAYTSSPFTLPAYAGWVALAVAIIAGTIAAWLLRRTRHHAVAVRTKSTTWRFLPVDTPSRFIAMNSGHPPGTVLSLVMLCGGLVAANAYPVYAVIAIFAYINFAAYGFMRRVWSSPFMEDLYLANWDPRELATRIPRAALTRILPALPPLVFAAMRYGYDSSATVALASLAVPDFRVRILTAAVAGFLALYILAKTIRDAAERELSTRQTPYAMFSWFLNAIFNVFIVLVFSRFYVAISYYIASVYSDNRETQHGFVYLMFAVIAVISVVKFVRETRDFENTLLRYFRENEFSDFGAFKPVGKSLWGSR